MGKSSVFNRLLEQERAIVTDIPGTTRDLVSETASIEGIPVKLVDTAGIREGHGLVETLGIERSFQAIADADLTLVVIDLSAPLDAADLEIVERITGPPDDGSGWATSRTCRNRAIEQRIPAHVGVDRRRRGGTAARNHSRSRSRGHPRARDWIHHQRPPRAVIERSAGVFGEGQGRGPAQIPHEMLLLDLYAALRPLDAMTGATTAMTS